jgi:hypothetical protein
MAVREIVLRARVASVERPATETKVWGPDDLTVVTSAAATDPTWLQLRAVINNARDR